MPHLARLAGPALFALPLALGLPLAPAMAAPPGSPQPNAANLYHQQQRRQIGIQNWSSENITSAELRTTKGHTYQLGNGKVSRNEAGAVLVPAHDCIAGISIKLQNGKTFSRNGLNDCHDDKIMVRNSGISLPQLAVPGAKQHGTPG
jgi:hypothetical protein